MINWEMIIIKINIKIVILSFLIAILMYPKTINFFANSVKNIYIAHKLSFSLLENYEETVNTDKIKIVFMFDGGSKSVYSEAYELLRKYNYRGSVSIIPSLINEKEFMSYEQLAELYLHDWDLLNLSYSHKESMDTDSTQLLLDFDRAREWMGNRYIGKHDDMLVMPYGEINPYLIGQLKEAGYRNIRTSSNIIVLENNKIEYFPVYTINLLADVTVNKVKERFVKILTEPKSVILIINKVGGDNEPSDLTYSKEKLEQILMFIEKNSGKFKVITYSQLF